MPILHPDNTARGVPVELHAFVERNTTPESLGKIETADLKNKTIICYTFHKVIMGVSDALAQLSDEIGVTPKAFEWEMAIAVPDESRTKRDQLHDPAKYQPVEMIPHTLLALAISQVKPVGERIRIASELDSASTKQVLQNELVINVSIRNLRTDLEAMGLGPILDILERMGQI